MPPTLDYASPDSNPRGPFWKLAIGKGFLVALVILGVIAILLPALSAPSKHRLAGPQVQCLSHLRQIGNALMMYAAQNNGVYPTQLADVCPLRVPAAALVCPSSKTETAADDGATTQQTLNNVLAGKHITYVYLVGGMQKSSLKPQAILAYEPVAVHGKAPNSSANVLFADGHVESVPAAVFAQMLKELNAGQNPPPGTARN
jgi:prepilin-type processing-associated H-X9-DG protein